MTLGYPVIRIRLLCYSLERKNYECPYRKPLSELHEDEADGTVQECLVVLEL